MTVTDWSLIEEPLVIEAVKQAAGLVGSRYGGVTTADDLEQEAFLIAATRPDVIRYYLDGPDPEARLFVYLRDRLKDQARTDARRSSKHVPFHLVMERQRDARDE